MELAARQQLIGMIIPDVTCIDEQGAVEGVMDGKTATPSIVIFLTCVLLTSI